MNEKYQYLRKSSLILEDKKGDGLEFSALRITFKITLSDFSSPNKAQIRIYNLSETNESIIKNEFSRITLQAGYEGNYGVIFKGNIKEIQKGRENVTDRFIEISAGDGDEAHNFAYISQTFDSGVTQSDQIKASIQSMNQYGVESGFIDELSDQKLPRGKVMFGMSKDYLSQSALTTQSTWSVQNGQVNLIKKTSTLPNSMVILNNRSGLIQTPIIVTEGVQFSCLLNPLLKVGGKVKINNKEALNDQESSFFDSDGTYRVLSLDHVGDNFGKDWVTTVTGLSIDETASNNNEVSPK